MSSTTYRICTLPGDGIGPEVMAEAKKVLAAVGERYDVEFGCTDRLIGGAAIDETCAQGRMPTALPEETLEAARTSDAVLLAAVGGPKWTSTEAGAARPEQGLLAIRSHVEEVREGGGVLALPSLLAEGGERGAGRQGEGDGRAA